MKRAVLAAAAMVIAGAALAANVGVSVSVGQPGFYGRIDINGMPPPRLVYREPIVVEPVGRYAAMITISPRPSACSVTAITETCACRRCEK